MGILKTIVIFKGKPMSSIPENFGKPRTVGIDFGYKYMDLYDNGFYEVYIDGCFYPYVGKYQIIV